VIKKAALVLILLPLLCWCKGKTDEPQVTGPSSVATALPTPDTCACDHMNFDVDGTDAFNRFPAGSFISATVTMLNVNGAILDSSCPWTKAFVFDPPSGNGCSATGNVFSPTRVITCINVGGVTLTSHATLNGLTCWGRWDGTVIH